MNTTEMVLERLKGGHSVSVLDCKNRFQCKEATFSSIISTLRGRGFKIVQTRQHFKEEKRTVFVYFLTTYTGLNERPTEATSAKVSDLLSRTTKYETIKTANNDASFCLS